MSNRLASRRAFLTGISSSALIARAGDAEALDYVLLAGGKISPVVLLDLTKGNTTAFQNNVVFSRSGTANYFDSTGTLQSAATGVARFPYYYNGAAWVPQGFLIEVAGTNVVLWNRDLTNAAWTKGATATVAKNQTGIDGVANSASSITGGAVSATNTVLQPITLASSARVQSAYVKRITGSGTVNMTTDGGATWTAITLTSAWARVVGPVQTLANPSVGFQVTTLNDVIAVDYVQNEQFYLSSPIATTSAAVTRATELAILTGAAASVVTAAKGTVIAETAILNSVATYPFILTFIVVI